MIRKKEDVKIQEKQVCGGRNSIFAGTLIENDEWKGAGRLFQKIVVPPMCEIGYHVHTGDSESYYMLKGSGLYNDNGTEVEIKEGDLTFTPEGCGHSFYNNTDKNVEILALILYNFKKGEDITKFRIIRHPGDFTKKELHAPFDGRGDFYGYLLMEGEEFTDAARVYNMMHMLPDCKLGFHPHNGETEVFYIVSGHGIFTDDDKEIEVGPGDVTITATGHSHALENRSSEELVYAAVIYFDKE